MKTLALIVVMIGASFINSTYAEGNFSIKDQLEKTIKFENNELPIETNTTEFVKVSFKINEAGEVEILEMNYSDEKIKAELINKLSKMKVDEDHNSEKVYNYNFTFKKM